MEKRARLKLSLDRLYIQNEEEKDFSILFIFTLLVSSWPNVYMLYVNIPRATITSSVITTITLIKSRFDRLHKIFTFTTRMFNAIQTHI